MEAQQCDECDDGWRRCRRRKSNPAVAAVGVDRESSPDITIIEALLSSSSSSSMGRIHDNTASMSAVSSSTCSQRPALFAAVGTATSATFPVNSSAKQQQNQQQTQRQQQQHHTKQSSPEILGERYQRHKNHTRNLNHRCALWILSLICGGRWYFCSAFQQQQLRQHYTLANSNVLELSHPTTDEDHTVTTTATRSLKINLTKLFFSPTNQREQQQQYPPTFNQPQRSDTSTTTTINNNSSKKRNPTNISIDNDDTADPRQQQPQRRKQYRRKLPLSPSEKSAALNRQKRRVAYETMRSKSLATTNAPPSIWSFDSFFAAPVLDEKSIREDLFGTKEREAEMMRERAMRKRMLLERRKERECLLRDAGDVGSSAASATDKTIGLGVGSGALESASVEAIAASTMITGNELDIINKVENDVIVADPSSIPSSQDGDEPRPPVDKVLTRMVQDRINGLTRSPAGSIQYSSSLLDSGRAVQFRDGIRLGKALTINIDRLCYFAKKDFSHGRLEEAQEYYMKARNMDPTDGRPYLGLSRIAQRRGDYEAARSLLKEGIAKSSGGFVVVKGPGGGAGGGGGSTEKEAKNGRRGNNRDNNGDLELDGEVESTIGTIPDIGPNPFLLQALGTLEQQLGQLAAAEELYLQALRSRPSHAAAWVSLAQLRTKELRQGASAGRACYQSAERELQRIGAKPNSFVYTAWASMEYKKGSREDDAKCVQKARELYQKALNVDPQCSAAYLQLGVMESECGNFDEAKMCFEKVLKFDQRNSRVLQAYAVMESRRAPKDEVDSRRVLDLFERALKANPRDAGVYQAYALYVSELGDIDSARKLLQKATEVNKRHAPAWQALGVLETRYSTAKAARDVFQQGIWSCARPGGGQSGGRDCARLWQAWGILEAQEGDHAAARRCFSRALDADKRNAAAVTAWTLMEAELGNFADARSIFERVLKLFRSPSVDKTAIWRAYEVMEERAGNTREAQLVFQRSMRESISSSTVDEELIFPLVEGGIAPMPSDMISVTSQKAKPSKRNKEVEVSSWSNGSDVLDAEVWMNNGSIEGRVPASMMRKLKNKRL